jgi:crotonobetainyl-CoA:carnitine CoA-transferase CaiB-like acyl-CoA transferase
MPEQPPGTAPAPAPGPLDGLTVLDFSTMMAGPHCTRMMADLGATVIKVESPEGDHMRKLRPRKSGSSRFFGQLNVGKRSVTLDLSAGPGREAALALVAQADIVLESWRPGVADRLGLAYQACRAVREDVIYCSISGWGQSGPNARRAAFAPVVHAASGFDLANLSYQPPGSIPPVTGVFVGDILGGTMAFGAILAGVRKRDATGAGSRIDLSLVEAMLSMPVYEFQAELADLREMRPSHRPVPTADGFIILTIVSDLNWRAVARALGQPGLGTDPRFVDVKARTLHWDDMHQLVCDWAAGRTAGQAEAEMLAAGVPAARYQSMASLLADEHLRTRGVFRTVADAAGEFTVTGTPFRFDDVVTPPDGSAVPALGADTDAVLKEAGHAGPGGPGDPAVPGPPGGPA